MPFRHGKNTKVLINASDLSSYFTDASVSASVEVAETTTYGVAGGSKTYVTGLNDATISLSGLFDGAAGAVDPIISAILGSDSDVNFTIGQDGGLSTGGRCIIGQAIDTKYDVKAPVSGVVSISADLQTDAGGDQGVCLVALSSVSATSTGTTAVDNTTSTSNGGVGMLHVTANTRNGSITNAKIQHSPDNTSWADLVTFATIGTTTTTSERVSVATGTTVNRYLRTIYTVAGSSGAATLTVAFARRY